MVAASSEVQLQLNEELVAATVKLDNASRRLEVLEREKQRLNNSLQEAQVMMMMLVVVVLAVTHLYSHDSPLHYFAQQLLYGDVTSQQQGTGLRPALAMLRKEPHNHLGCLWVSLWCGVQALTSDLEQRLASVSAELCSSRALEARLQQRLAASVPTAQLDEMAARLQVCAGASNTVCEGVHVQFLLYNAMQDLIRNVLILHHLPGG